jgi:uncharacterized protein YcaQ
LAEGSLSGRQARRVAIFAQGFGRPRPSTAPGKRDLARALSALGAIQLDSVNVLIRSHYLPLFSRLGAYPRDLLDTQAWGDRPSLFEYWGHEASLLPVAIHPLFRWRMARARQGETWSGLARFGREKAAYIKDVLRRIDGEGPVSSGDFPARSGPAGWWNWSDGKRALEWLFWAGMITTRTRRGFTRVYDLTERVIPAAVMNMPTPTEPDAQRTLLEIAGKALGVATAGDLRDYFRLPVAGIPDRLNELVEAGALTPVSVEGWRDTAYLATAARPRLRTDTVALLSPFDSLIWRRERAERLFGVRIRLEVYTPAIRREHGYYVLPLLVGDRIVARADLKADRSAGVLLVQAAHSETGLSPDAAAAKLAEAARAMASWLALDGVVAMPKGDLSAPLGEALR